MIQEEMISKVRDLAMNDNRVSAVLMYGSFIKGEGDRFSDIEFYIFTYSDFNKTEWVEKIAPLALFFKNEYGTDVAVFENLIRGEFHFSDITGINVILSWQGYTSFRYRNKMILVDKENKLQHVLDSIIIIEPDYNEVEYAETAVQMLINYLIFSKNLILRGETAHAHQLFFSIQKALLWLIRLHTGCTQHWESPTKKLEEDIPQEWYEKYTTCVPGLNLSELSKSHENIVTLSNELFNSLNIENKYKQILNRIKSME